MRGRNGDLRHEIENLAYVLLGAVQALKSGDIRRRRDHPLYVCLELIRKTIARRKDPVSRVIRAILHDGWSRDRLSAEDMILKYGNAEARKKWWRENPE